MNRTYRAGVLALALTAFVAAPVAANAGAPAWLCLPKVPVTSAPSAPSGIDALPIVYVFAYFLCAGMALGKADQDAKNAGTMATHKQHRHALLACLNPIGVFWKLDHHQPI